MPGEQISEQEISKQLLGVVTSLCPDGQTAHVTGGKPESPADDFQYHYVIYGLESESGVPTGAYEIDDKQTGKQPLTVEPDGTIARKEQLGRRISAQAPDEFELKMTLRELQEGQVVDGEKFVIVDTDTPLGRREGTPNQKRIYKRKSIRYLGHKLLKTTSDIFLEK
jgi:hypothetical protein